MKKNNRSLTVLIVAILLIAVVVVFVVRGRGDQADQVVLEPVRVTEAMVTNTEVPAAETQQEAEPTQSEVEETKAAPELKVGLIATDPAGVSLASGDIQLVEVFAFW